ncbi:MAG: type I methionyl aminopeptidase [Bacteroidales bacterium]|nr:MAG: type I methionyl aminopeptidase [Bacteroidales bacterium]
MLIYKSEEEIELLRESNFLVSKTLAEVARLIKPGVTTLKLDKVAEEFIRDHRGEPGFKGYNGFPNTLCTSVNDEVVHGIPSSYRLKQGDIVSIDCGVILNGYYGDSAFTFPVGTVQEKIGKLLACTRESLVKGVEKAVEGKRLGDIGFAIQQHAESGGFSVVREMVGHGLGKNLHEPPEVPNYGKRGKGIKLTRGLVICIEPMINLGLRNISQDKDGWTIRTIDKLPSAHFEYAVAIQKGKPDILSTFDYIDEILNK